MNKLAKSLTIVYSGILRVIFRLRERSEKNNTESGNQQRNCEHTAQYVWNLFRRH